MQNHGNRSNPSGYVDHRESTQVDYFLAFAIRLLQMARKLAESGGVSAQRQITLILLGFFSYVTIMLPFIVSGQTTGENHGKYECRAVSEM